MGAYLPTALLAGLLNLPVFVPSNLAVLLAGPWSAGAGAGAVAVADVCACVQTTQFRLPHVLQSKYVQVLDCG